MAVQDQILLVGEKLEPTGEGTMTHPVLGLWSALDISLRTKPFQAVLKHSRGSQDTSCSYAGTRASCQGTPGEHLVSPSPAIQ